MALATAKTLTRKSSGDRSEDDGEAELTATAAR